MCIYTYTYIYIYTCIHIAIVDYIHGVLYTELSIMHGAALAKTRRADLRAPPATYIYLSI